MLIDTHAHYIPSEILRDAKPDETWRPRVYRDAQGRQIIEHSGSAISTAPREIVDIDSILSEQKVAEVDVLVVSPWTSLLNYDLDTELGLRACRLYNETIARRVRDHPGRLAGLGIVPLQDAALAAKEAERIILELNLNGIEIGTSVNGKYLGDECFLPFWEAVADLDAYVFIHPVPLSGRPMMRQYELGNLFGNPIETGANAASLIFGGVMERFPTLKISLAHGGGVLPYIIGRFDRGWQVRPEAKKSKMTRSPSTYLKQFYFDTILFSREALLYLIQVVGAGHVMIGSDYPFDMGYERPSDLVESLGLPKEQAALIFYETAARLLKIKI